VTKEKLRTYRSIKLERDHLALMIEELEGELYSPKAQRLDGMPHGGSRPGSIVEEAATRHAELLDIYRQKEAELSAAMVEIEKAIEALEPRERTLIRLYYAKGLTWEEVCVAMSYSWRQIHRIHGQALEALKTERGENDGG
jgi:RNA polymerase sigma factor (sigma-70 family)